MASKEDLREPWTAAELPANVAIRGFHNVTLSLKNVERTAEILKDVFGYRLKGQHVNRYRFETDAVENGSNIDLVEVPGEKSGINAGGTVHHVAFRVKDDASQLFIREKLVGKGLEPTQVIDRNYFHSVYFREPGGVLFEIATDNPGFMVDEKEEELGTFLRLPAQYENRRMDITNSLPDIG